MYSEISKCRISGSRRLITVLHLGEQYLTGVFPKSPAEKITKGPLELIWCPDSELLQLRQSYDLSEMYNNNYGYRSGLNATMVRHLAQKINFLERMVKLTEQAIVVDIGSNDATLLKACAIKCRKVGIDPIGKKFQEFYTDDIVLLPHFFSADVFTLTFPKDKAKIITSIAMFYDIEDPNSFVRDVESVLADDGVWYFEQSYMPSMLRMNSYDTICHEHLEFYSFKIVKRILENYGLRVLDVQMNTINGGSFAVTACKKDAGYESNIPMINWMLKQEENMGLDTLKPYLDFKERVFRHRKDLTELIETIVGDGKKILGYGASTKGNVLLQFCGLTKEHIPYIAEVNKDKFGCCTPGTNIPIISEEEARAMKPDYFFVLPWHFKNNILEREKDFMANGGKLIFPLPKIEII